MKKIFDGTKSVFVCEYYFRDRKDPWDCKYVDSSCLIVKGHKKS